MKVTAKTKPANQVEHRTKTRPYKRPVLTEFGKLHVLTRATGTRNGDGGQNMMS